MNTTSSKTIKSGNQTTRTILSCKRPKGRRREYAEIERNMDDVQRKIVRINTLAPLLSREADQTPNKKAKGKDSRSTTKEMAHLGVADRVERVQQVEAVTTPAAAMQMLQHMRGHVGQAALTLQGKVLDRQAEHQDQMGHLNILPDQEQVPMRHRVAVHRGRKRDRRCDASTSCRDLASTKTRHAHTIIQKYVLTLRKVRANLVKHAKIFMDTNVPYKKLAKLTKYLQVVVINLQYRKTRRIPLAFRKRNQRMDANNPILANPVMAPTKLWARKQRTQRSPLRKIVDMPRRSSLSPLARGELLPTGLFFTRDDATASADANAFAPASAPRPTHHRYSG